ncbi:hypothetical protein [Treponema parvum]|uniref:hypothetical protein n=1 Tax=Treponema parvum TaxID=138851 RepID=UPI001AEC40D6|nr:hypothetical protein [Treponema parvum]QTQ16341.1 hypothetical protein HXT04_06360 [Treponema parvum]
MEAYKEAKTERRRSLKMSFEGDFGADAPNKKWLTDITQVPCKDGKLYLFSDDGLLCREEIVADGDGRQHERKLYKAPKENMQLKAGW